LGFNKIEMKKFLIIAGYVAMGMLITSCSRVRRNTGRAYMPDMYYSRAYETYASTEALEKEGANYNRMPVAGTMARGDMLPYPFKNDSAGYAQSATIKNPLDSASIDKTEAERLYLVNCGICHGTKLDGNGPLWKGGDGPFPAAPKNFMADDMKKMAEGTMFHSVTFGKNLMGSYASQLSTKQRWMVIAYIKSKQGGGAQPDSTKTPAVNKDSTAVKKG
jgi:mono/diheme cytochrome c family protein